MSRKAFIRALLSSSPMRTFFSEASPLTPICPVVLPPIALATVLKLMSRICSWISDSSLVTYLDRAAILMLRFCLKLKRKNVLRKRSSLHYLCLLRTNCTNWLFITCEESNAAQDTAL